MEASPLSPASVTSGEPIVLVPGGLSGWLSWIPFVEPLAKDRQVVRVQLCSVELAEAGRPVPPDYGAPAEREVLRATIDHRGLDRTDLVGWSCGGHVALAFALEHPQRVHILTLIEPAAVWILCETRHAVSALEQNEAFARSTTGKEISIEDRKGFLRGPQRLPRPGGPGVAVRRRRGDAGVAGLGPQPAGGRGQRDILGLCRLARSPARARRAGAGRNGGPRRPKTSPRLSTTW